MLELDQFRSFAQSTNPSCLVVVDQVDEAVESRMEKLLVANQHANYDSSDRRVRRLISNASSSLMACSVPCVRRSSHSVAVECLPLMMLMARSTRFRRRVAEMQLNDTEKLCLGRVRDAAQRCGYPRQCDDLSSSF